MAGDRVTVQELLEKLDHDREAYLSTLARAHELLAQTLAQTQPGTTFQLPPASSTVQTAAGGLPLSPKLPPSLSSRRAPPSSVFELESFKKGSVYTADESSESDDDESFFVQDALPVENYTEDQLREHLSKYEWTKHGLFMVKELFQQPDILEPSELLQDKSAENTHDAPHHSDIYEVSADGSALHATKAESVDGFKSIWAGLHRVNGDETRRQAVGRLTVLREPSALLLNAVHLTMNRHLDMDSIFRLLIDDSPTKAYMKGCLKDDIRHRSSFVFVLKYHTIVGANREPMPWQRSDEDLNLRQDHIPISSCSSIVALSLGGTTTQTLRRKSRRTKQIVGHIYDPFAPWRVLSLQCFPDWHSSVEVHDTNHHYVNGPEAFMVTVLAEYRDASKRFRDLNRRVVKLVTPPKEFLFSKDLRDKLLFENDSYSYSRRYFWAFQALALLNDEIEAMITQYHDNFTDEVWTGEHKYIWPGNKDKSARYSNWRKRMGTIRKQFEVEIKQLQQVLKDNQQEQKDIKSLRDQLFSGTSVLESREAVHQARITVDQGYNIRLLTLVSIFFLPLTFVTSIFGMTNINPDQSFIPFGIVLLAICVPTYFLIGTVNAPGRFQAIWKRILILLAPLLGWFKFGTAKQTAEDEKAAQHSGQHRRRLSRSLSGLETTNPAMQTGYEQKPVIRRVNTGSLSSPRPEMSTQRESMITFQEPEYDRPSKPLKRPSGSLAFLEKSMSDPGPLPLGADEAQEPPQFARRSFLRSVSDRLRGNESPKSSV